MTAPFKEYVSLEAALNARYRGHDSRDWDEWNTIRTDDAADVSIDAERAWVVREKTSHRGISARKCLKHLIAGSVDQDFLDEICQVERLERLELEYPVTASSLDGLRNLKHLRHLSIDSPRNVTDFTPLLELRALTTLLITNARHMTDVEWLAAAHHLEVLGVEGSIWTQQRIPTFGPIRGLKGIKAFLATSVRLGDKDLSPLADCPNLEFLGCARFAPRQEFERLHDLKPDLICSWFRMENWN